jgi:Cof subfamily protein (haloacid dehalogenase superfamily)
MKKINYGLIISDFDGTLVNDDGTISELNKEMIAKYREEGGAFAISTGRLPNGILSRATELGLKGAVSCSHGAVIVDIESKELLFCGAIPNATAVQICQKMEEWDLHIHVYLPWEFYCNKDDEALKYYEMLTRTKARLILDKPLSVYLQETGIDVCKFCLMVHPKDNQRVLEYLKQQNFEDCVVTKSNEYLVEVLSVKYSKGTAVEFLSQYYNVPIEKTIAVGDQLNDIPMVERAGLGIAVKNADNGLKEKAKLIFDYTHEEGAVGRIIEKYGFIENE